MKLTILKAPTKEDWILVKQAAFVTQVLRGRRLNSNTWFNLETYDFWDELELIEVSSDKEEEQNDQI